MSRRIDPASLGPPEAVIAYGVDPQAWEQQPLFEDRRVATLAAGDRIIALLAAAGYEVRRTDSGPG